MKTVINCSKVRVEEKKRIHFISKAKINECVRSHIFKGLPAARTNTHKSKFENFRYIDVSV